MWIADFFKKTGGNKVKEYKITITDNRNYPNTLWEAKIYAPNMIEAINQAKHECCVKRVLKIYENSENFYSALLSNRRFRERFLEIYLCE